MLHLPFLRCVGCWPSAACDAVWGGTYVWPVSTPLQPHTTHGLQLQAAIRVPLLSGRCCLLCALSCPSDSSTFAVQSSGQGLFPSLWPAASQFAPFHCTPILQVTVGTQHSCVHHPIPCLLCSLHTHSITGWHSAVSADSCALPCCPCAVMSSMQHTGWPVVYCLCLCVHSITCRGD